MRVRLSRRMGPYSYLPGTDIAAQGQIFLLQFQATERLGHLGVADDQRAQQLRRQNVQGHNALIASHRDHGALAAVGCGCHAAAD